MFKFNYFRKDANSIYLKLINNLKFRDKINLIIKRTDREICSQKPSKWLSLNSRFTCC